MENPLLIVIFIALGFLEAWGVVWFALIVVGLAGYVLLLRLLHRITGPLSGVTPEWKNALTGGLMIFWGLMLFAFADWWWNWGFMY